MTDQLTGKGARDACASSGVKLSIIGVGLCDFCNVAIYRTNILIFVPSVQIFLIDLLPGKYEDSKGTICTARVTSFAQIFVFENALFFRLLLLLPLLLSSGVGQVTAA